MNADKRNFCRLPVPMVPTSKVPSAYLAKLEEIKRLADCLLPFMYDERVMENGPESDFEAYVRDLAKLLKWKYHRPVPHPEMAKRNSKKSG